jgi:periplasmic protein TonB
MFEDSLMESGHKIRTRSRQWSAFSLLVNIAALLSLMIWPLLHPEALPRQTMAALLVAPAPPPPPPPVMPVPSAQIKSEVLSGNQLAAPSKIPKAIRIVNDAPEPQMANGVRGMEGLANGTPGAMGTILSADGRASVSLAPAVPPKKVSISSGVMAGNLIEKTVPQYPAIAKAARIQGTVVLAATISKSGSIENLRVISGPPMLVQSALDAVRSWRYKPYLLNDTPVEVETTVNVVFNLGG